MKKLTSIFLSGALLIAYTPMDALATEKEDVDFVESELELIIEDDIEMNPEAAIGTLVFVPGVGLL